MHNEFEKALQQLPLSIQPFVNDAWQQYLIVIEKNYSKIPTHPDFIFAICRAFASSEFILQNCLRYPDTLLDLFESGDILLEYPAGEYEKKLAFLIKTCQNQTQFFKLIREFRRREMLRIAWRDILKWAVTKKTLTELSRMADACVNSANQFLYKKLCVSMGTPIDLDTNKPIPLLVLAMGKLGAYELNFSSDIDLIYCFPKDGILPSGKSYHQFFLHLAQQLTQCLNSVTEDGFVYRVDLRLRPYGNAGSLACSFAMLEDYYLTQGREWERYALVKARILNHEKSYSPTLMNFIGQFVYRNYIDYSAIESLRLLQEKIVLEVKKHSLENNIKRGRGGIREIEFIAQTYKIIRGGKQFRLQERNTLKSLILLRETRSISEQQYHELSSAYTFLRSVENKLQMFRDQQSHELPTDKETQTRIAYAMRYGSWSNFMLILEKHRHSVQFWFDRLISKPKLSFNKEKENQQRQEFEKAWTELVENKTNLDMLRQLGFEAPTESLHHMLSLKAYIEKQQLSKTAHKHLLSLLPYLLTLITDNENPSALLKRMLALIEAIIDNSIYLVLLGENPLVLSQAVKLCAASPWIADELARHPVLLDELLDPKTLYAPPSVKVLRRLLNQQLQTLDDNELDKKIETICWFKQRHVLRVAAADITGTLPLMRVSDYLTDIATVIVDKVRELLLQDLITVYGEPNLPRRYKDCGFVVVAYGKLGGIELSYSSDLDLVFLHPECDPQRQTNGDNAISNEKFYTRLGQRLLQTFNQLRGGSSLYKIDLRLRPSGQSGLLVNSVQAFASYQTQQAWNWEHQALVRSRQLCGSNSIGKQFEKIRRTILASERQPQQLADNIIEMREKMRDAKLQHQEHKFDLKQGVGGLVDIEFIAQYAVLRWSHTYPSLLDYPDNVRIFERVGMEGLLSMKQVTALTEAYKAYRSHLHRAALQNDTDGVDDELFAFYRHSVTKIWQEIITATCTSHDKMPEN